MRLKLRIHEWLAERVTWVQYPRIRRLPTYTRPSVWHQYQRLTRKERGWFWFSVFWGALFLIVQMSPSD